MTFPLHLVSNKWRKIFGRDVAQLENIAKFLKSPRKARVGTANVMSFALNKAHVIDFVLRNGGFSSVRLQGFVCLWLKPCNFGSAHEAPSTP